ncbi:MAG: phage tape measure protein [Clostridia bacterium]|nr:phage tape measure protein [Clostridia bacterium]
MASIGKLMQISLGKSALKTAIKTDNISDSIKSAEKTFDNVSYLIDSFTKDMGKVFLNYTDSLKKLGGAVDDTDGKTVKDKKKAKGKNAAKDEETDRDEEEPKKAKKKEKSGDNGLKKSFENIQNAISSINFSGIKSGLDYIDKYTSVNNKIARISRSDEEAVGLKSKILEVANSSSTSYPEMANSIADLGSLDVFKTNDKAVDFAGIMQKSLKLDGSNQSLAGVSSSMSDGTISGEEFSSLVSSAPTIGAAMSSATGKSVSELQKLAEQGMITAEVLKKSMFMSGDKISTQFASQPKTFADIWTQVTNKVMGALAPLIQLFSEMINSAAFQGAIDVIISGLTYVASLASSLATFIMNNGNLIKSILFALGAVLLVVLAASIASWFMMYLPIILIVGAITLIIFALSSMGVSFQDIFSFIGGVIGVFYATFYNMFIYMWNIVASFINFFGNAFNNPIASTKILFLELVSNILGYFGTIIKGIEDLINKIPGFKVDITSGITDLRDDLNDKIISTKNESGYKEIVKAKEFLDYSDAASSGSLIVSDAFDTLQGIYDSSKDPNKKIYGSDKVNLDNNGLGSSNSPLSTEITGSSGAVDVNMAEEDTQYLRNLAEREFINKFNTTSLSPNVSITFGDVHETADAEKVSKRIAQILREQIAVAAEGAY